MAGKAYKPETEFSTTNVEEQGKKLDVELANIKDTLAEVQTTQSAIQRDDNKLANKSVSLESLDDSVKGLYFSQKDYEHTGDWIAGKDYKYRQSALINGVVYGCLEDHESYDFVLDSKKWVVVDGLKPTDVKSAAHKEIGIREDQVLLGKNSLITFDSLMPIEDGGQASNAIDADLELGQKVKTLGYKKAGDGGGSELIVDASDSGVIDNGSFTQMKNGLVLRLVISNTVNIRQFGALGVSDDTVAVQAACIFAHANDIPLFVPSGRYTVSDTSVIPFGNSFTMHGVFSEKTTRGSLFLSDMKKPVFKSETAMSMTGVGFIHTGVKSEEGTLAVECQLSSNADDMDCSFDHCTFMSYYTAVDSYGRGLHFVNNACVYAKKAVIRRWDTPNQEFPAQPNNTDLPNGYRANVLSDNRFHAMGYDGVALEVVDDSGIAFFRGALVAKNLIDLNGQLFKGAAHNSTFIGNVCDINSNTSTSRAVIDFIGPSVDNVILGNTFSGYTAGAGNALSATSDRCIAFRSDCIGTVLSGNTFAGFVTAAIYWIGSFSYKGNVVSGNSFHDCGAAILGSGQQLDMKELGNTYNNCNTNFGISNIGGDSYIESMKLLTSDTTILKTMTSGGGDGFEILHSVAGIAAIELDTKGKALSLNCESLRPSSVDASIPLGVQVRPFAEVNVKNGVVAQSPDGTWYRATPSNGGGATVWTAV